jgi:chromosome segregation ATPase
MLQYKCLETRLQLAEERLNQDRQQRVDRMSKTEADLLVETTSLKVTCDELQRQVEREREKVNTLEVRLGKMQMQPAAGDSAHGHLNGDSLSSITLTSGDTRQCQQLYGEAAGVSRYC